MADRVLNVKVTGDTSSLGHSFQKASTQSKSFGSSMHSHIVGTLKEVGKAAEYAGALIGVSFVAAVGDGIHIAAQNQVALTKLKKSVDNSGLSWQKLGGHIRETEDRMAGLSGFTNTDLETSLATLITTTGKVTSAQKLQSEAMDLSRAKGMSLQQASVVLSKVWNGNVTSLTRLGVYLHKSTTNYDAYMASTTHATAAGKAHAKELDLIANRQAALSQLQKKFGGSSAAYAKTASGALDRIRASADILLERLGAVLLPYLNKFASWFAQHLPEIQQKGTVVFGALRDVILQIVHAVKYAIGFYQRWSTWIQAVGVFIGVLVGGFEAYLAVQKAVQIATKVWTAAQIALDAAMSANPLGIAIVAAALLAAAFVVLWKRSATFRDIVRTSLGAIQTAFHVVVGFIQAHWGAAMGFVTAAAHHVWSVVGPIIGFIHDHWKTLIALIPGIGPALYIVVNHFGLVKTVAGKVIRFIIDRWGNIKSALSTFAGWVNKYVIGPIKTIISWARKAISILEALSLGSSNSTAGRTGQGGNSSSANIRLASSQMSRYGWGSDQMNSLIPLWNQESGWNANAVNPSSNAQGIPQLLPSAHPGAHPGFPSWPPVNPGSQIGWGLGYIRGSYGSPAGAWAHEQKYNWYDKGGVVPGPRGVHRPIWAAGGETILPTHKNGGMPQVIVVPVMLERDLDTAVRKSLGNTIRTGNPVSIGGKTLR